MFTDRVRVGEIGFHALSKEITWFLFSWELFFLCVGYVLLGHTALNHGINKDRLDIFGNYLGDNTRNKNDPAVKRK